MYAALRVIVPTLLFLTSTFLILLVLVQRGRGGGLAGAFGGLGGQSAFGTKAGDLFTRVTVITAFLWITLCAASVKLLNDSGSSIIDPTLGGSASAAPQPGGGAQPAGAGTAADTESSTAADTESSPPAGAESSPPAEDAEQKPDQ